MATALYQFERCHVGLESVKGSLVPATRALVGQHNMLEETTFYRSPYPAGARANMGGAGTPLEKGTVIDVSTDLTAEEILWPLSLGVRGGITPTTVDGTARKYTFTPELTTGAPTIQTATVEMIRSDGVTNHYYGESGHGMCESFKIDWTFSDIAKLTWKLFARARQTGTPTPALVPYPSRNPLASNQLGVTWDTSYAGMGGTPLVGLIRSASFECATGFEADHTLDGRVDVDFGNYKVGNLTAKLQLVMELDANAATKYTAYRTNSLVYIRLDTTGLLAGATTELRRVRIDGAYRFAVSPTFAADGEQILVTIDLESVYDTAAAKTLEFEVTNALTALN